MAPRYFWVDDKVVELGEFREITHPLLCRPCVDTAYGDAHNRYGQYTKKKWQPCAVEDLPPLFRAHLLLLGVS